MICSYEAVETREDCAAQGLICGSGRCMEAEGPVECQVAEDCPPPPPVIIDEQRCSGDLAVHRRGARTRCEARRCIYHEDELLADCSEDGIRCVETPVEDCLGIEAEGCVPGGIAASCEAVLPPEE